MQNTIERKIIKPLTNVVQSRKWCGKSASQEVAIEQQMVEVPQISELLMWQKSESAKGQIKLETMGTFRMHLYNNGVRTYRRNCAHQLIEIQIQNNQISQSTQESRDLSSQRVLLHWEFPKVRHAGKEVRYRMIGKSVDPGMQGHQRCHFFHSRRERECQ